MVKLTQHMPLTDPTKYFHHQQQITSTLQQQSQWQLTQGDSQSHQAKDQNDGENWLGEHELIEIGEADRILRETPSLFNPVEQLNSLTMVAPAALPAPTR
ncbi:unnamed protein product [Didymodactylos carnosus]|uniref:Uncharacterized protein n=1 Tax=Didymodactylos carnosus TaxID=1234261 RepID=A0A8S2FMF7_9BILA|nr:unnamed protein product [Didymodactylos carnosus]CAF4292605.1 unnamed protein product [Didymodactylos carnosus]